MSMIQKSLADTQASYDNWPNCLLALDLTSARKLSEEHARTHGPWQPRLDLLPTTGLDTLGLFAPQSIWRESLPTELLGNRSYTFCYPRLENGKLQFHVCQEKNLKPGTYGIKEPPTTAQIVEPQLLLVPALLCDKRGHRIGRGKGYYDRYLAQHPQTSAIAVLHSDYLLDLLPTSWLHSGDMKVHGILTEYEFISLKEFNL